MLQNRVGVVAPFATKQYKYISYKSKLMVIFCLGISSGLPFLLLLSTMSIWLTESGVSKTKIGLFTFTTIPYALKFLIAPFCDKFKLPLLGNFLGQRRAWILFFQVGLIFSLIALGNSVPHENLLYTAIIALSVGFFSACQDIVVEAYRIEILDADQLGPGSTASVLGYRIGMLVAGAGAIYISSYFNNWIMAYNIMGCCIGIGIITILLAPEPDKIISNFKNIKILNSKNEMLSHWLKRMLNALFMNPVKSLLQANNIFIVLAFIVSFKLADTVLNIMTMPFLLDMGFSKLDIATVAKTFGISAMIFGGIFAGMYLSKNNLYRLLLLCTGLQIIASILFILQAKVGNNIILLFFTMGIENITCGMSQVALVSYFSMLCNQQYTATHYALLSSFASLMRVQFSSISGIVADSVNWDKFYLIVTISCIPCILILLRYKHVFQQLKFSKITVKTKVVTPHKVAS